MRFGKMTMVLGILAAPMMATGAGAGTAMEQALANGATQLTGDQIAARLGGKTVVFELASTGGRYLVYYDGVNGMRLAKVGGEKVMKGFYAIDTADHVCFGIQKDAPLKLRCVSVLVVDGKLHKYELDGSLRGRVLEEADGNTM